MDYRTALAALEMDVLRAVVLLLRVLVHERIRNHRLVLDEPPALRHLLKIPVDCRLVHIHTVLLQERRQLPGRESMLHLGLDELRNQICRLRVV